MRFPHFFKASSRLGTYKRDFGRKGELKVVGYSFCPKRVPFV